MQRVAIARALVNDPDILLADEPTGALDSETSIQVMDLLKKVAEDRLVVMVTHNPELAQKYATRIVALRDGKIRSDSDPFEPEKDSLAEPQHKNMGKASMSFLTALSLSFNNLKTKKARTILTSFAGSIGIIGIALILSLSTGVNRYIETVETETLSQYPLQIQSTGIDLTSMLTDMGSAAESEGDGAASGNSEKAGDDINVIDMLSGMFATVNSNDLTALKDYLENGGSGIEQYTSAIEYSYDTDPLIFGKTDGGYRQVNPDTSFEALGFGSSSGANSMMSTMMSTDMFYQMPEDPDLYQSQYDVKAGRWPQNYNECVLVLTQNGNISDFMLYTLGLRDYRELDDMIQQFINEESVTVPESSGSYSYEEILDISFKLVNAADMYEYDSRYGVWKDKEDDKDYMNSLIEKGEEIKIIGIVQPSEDANGLMLMAGIGYPASLTEHVAEQAAQSEIVKEQIADRTVNVFTGESFGSENESGGPDLSGLFSIDTSKLQSAFKVDEQALSSAMEDIFADAAASGGESISTETIQQMMAGMFASYLQTPEASAIVAGGIAEMIQANGGMTISAEQMQSLMTEIMQGYQLYAQQNGYTDPARFGEYLAEYMETAEAEAVINSWTEENFGSVESMTPDQQLMSKMTAQLMAGYMEYARSAAGSAEIPGTDAGMTVDTDAMASEMAAAMENAITIDENAFAESFKMDMDGDELTELMMSMSGSESATAESNLRSLGYVDFDDPSMISIYPLDFESKEQVSRILDEYNEDMKASGNEEKAVTYTDIVGAMMSSVTTIIDVISYVLIAFVAISLIVSSIMIGVITYISVLERQKEIGILRAIGASKGNISQVFNAETFIIGLCAGIMGIVTSLLILIPGNALIHHLAGTNDVSAVLPAIPAVILILLSVVLTLIGGIIPSRKAAKSDPVTALRTE